MSNLVECFSCDSTFSLRELRENTSKVRKSGEVLLTCSTCGSLLRVDYYCDDCGVWWSDREELQTYTKRGRVLYVCPDCDGWLRKGTILAEEKL